MVVVVVVVVVRFLDEEVDEVRGRGFGPISDMAILATRSREGVGVPADGILLF